MTSKVDISDWIKQIEEGPRETAHLPTLEELDKQAKIIKESGQLPDPNWEETLKAKIAYLNQKIAKACGVLKK